MKSKNLIAVLSAGMLLAVASAYADEDVKNNINHQNLSKRPYQQAPVESKQDSFEGATLISADIEEDKNYKSMRLHMLGKRPYAEKNVD